MWTLEVYNAYMTKAKGEGHTLHAEYLLADSSLGLYTRRTCQTFPKLYVDAYNSQTNANFPWPMHIYICTLNSLSGSFYILIILKQNANTKLENTSTCIAKSALLCLNQN